MNPIILSNAASPLKTLLHSTSSYQPYTYSVRSNAPNSTLTRVKVNASVPITAQSFGDSISFTVPRYGLWQSACMKFKIKVHANASNQRFTNWLGCFLASGFTLSSHNKLIQQIDSENLLHEATFGVDANQRKTNGLIYHEESNWALYKAATASTVANPVVREVTVLVPLPFTFMQNTGSYLDTSFVEQLTVGCKLASTPADLMYSETLAGNSNGWEFSGAQLLCDFVSLEDKERRAVQAANYSMTKPLTLLTTQYFREASKTFTIPAASTAKQSVNLEIRCNALTECTYWRIIETTAGSLYNKGRAMPPAWADYSATQRNLVNSAPSKISASGDDLGNVGLAAGVVALNDDVAKYAGWTSYSVHASGVTICEVEADEQLLGWGGRSARAVSAMTNNTASSAISVVSESEQYLGSTDGFQTASWAGDAKKAGGAYDSGSMSYRMLVNPQLTVDFDAGTADGGERSFVLQCMHRCLNLTSVSSSDGRITQSVSI
jgi:hypothetical protein